MPKVLVSDVILGLRMLFLSQMKHGMSLMQHHFSILGCCLFLLQPFLLGPGWAGICPVRCFSFSVPAWLCTPGWSSPASPPNICLKQLQREGAFRRIWTHPQHSPVFNSTIFPVIAVLVELQSLSHREQMTGFLQSRDCKSWHCLQHKAEQRVASTQPSAERQDNSKETAKKSRCHTSYCLVTEPHKANFQEPWLFRFGSGISQFGSDAGAQSTSAALDSLCWWDPTRGVSGIDNKKCYFGLALG